MQRLPEGVFCPGVVRGEASDLELVASPVSPSPGRVSFCRFRVYGDLIVTVDVIQDAVASVAFLGLLAELVFLVDQREYACSTIALPA